ncbi:MAG: hypothetical protein KF687_10155 [Cyclobacteriaceae bacterium]|nr:hypothetical protein [Cyclobacteriaceae bacterium]
MSKHRQKALIGFRALILYVVIFSGIAEFVRAQGLFDSEDVLSITLTGSLSEVFRNRTGDPVYYPASISYTWVDSIERKVPLRIRTRGNFRRQSGTCAYPPLLLNFNKHDVAKTIFSEQDKVKLVMPCQGEKFVLREYLVYKLYNELTPKSFRARLVRVTLADTDLKTKITKTFYGILIEEEEQMATRNGLIAVERSLVRPEHTVIQEFLTMAIFQYMIGNTDWSVQYRQNIKLIGADDIARPYAVPYDFDHAGIVGAPYAKPAQELALGSVRDRRYRGFCVTEMKEFRPAIEQFNTLKESFYDIYRTNALLDDGYKRATLKYLDAFYATINNPKRVKEAFQYPCLKSGTGNVVIKGLNKD